MVGFRQRLSKITATAKTEEAKREEKERLLKIHSGIVKGRWIWTALFGMSSMFVVLMKKFYPVPTFTPHIISQNVGFYAILVFLIIYNLAFGLYLKRGGRCTWESLNVLRYLQVGCDLVLAACLFHLIGGIDNPTLLIYLLPFLVTAMLFGRIGVVAITTLSIGITVLITFLEHYHLIGHHYRYLFDIGIFGNLPLTLYFIITYTLSFFGGAVFAALLANVLNEKEKNLKEKTFQLEDANASLEIKVRARTRELSETTSSLEAQVRERTKELDGRMNELERFNKLALGREAKVAELEEKRRQFRKELRNLRE